MVRRQIRLHSKLFRLFKIIFILVSLKMLNEVMQDETGI